MSATRIGIRRTGWNIMENEMTIEEIDAEVTRLLLLKSEIQQRSEDIHKMSYWVGKAFKYTTSGNEVLVYVRAVNGFRCDYTQMYIGKDGDTYVYLYVDRFFSDVIADLECYEYQEISLDEFKGRMMLEIDRYE